MGMAGTWNWRVTRTSNIVQYVSESDKALLTRLDDVLSLGGVGAGRKLS